MSRVALLVGNESYKRLGKLATPKNDVTAIAIKLRKLGFVVTEQINVGKEQFMDALIQFKKSVETAETSLFFFAGHGFQFNGQNYLTPIDADGDDVSELAVRCINVETILEWMSKYSKPSLVFLDACRDSPDFRNFMRRATVQTRDMRLAFGFAKLENIEERRNTYVAFSTKPGKVARDTMDGSKNSPYVNALLFYMDRPGSRIESIMTDVRDKVWNDTKGAQMPCEESSLCVRFYFDPSDAIEKHDLEEIHMERATLLDVDRFLVDYPNSKSRVKAIHIFKNKLERNDNVGNIEGLLKRMHCDACVQITLDRLRELSWESLRFSKDIPGVTAFVERFPDFHEAKERLAQLYLLKIKTASEIKTINEFISNFQGTEAAKEAEKIRQRLRQKRLGQKVVFSFANTKEKRHEKPLASIRTLRNSKVFALVIALDFLLICLSSFVSNLTTALLSGMVTLIAAVDEWIPRASTTNSEAFWRFLALVLTSLIFSSSLSDFFNTSIFGLSSFWSLIWFWVIVISIIGVVSFLNRVRTISFLLSTAYGVTLAIALLLASKQSFSYTPKHLLVVGPTLAFWLIWFFFRKRHKGK